MYPIILPIYGPFALQSYGFCIAIGLLAFAWLLWQDKQLKSLINEDQFHTFFLMGVVAALLGGRALFFLTNEVPFSFVEFFQFWQGGFAVLGSLLSVLGVMSFLLYRYKIPVLPMLDRVALYTPLLHSISRIGCFLSGCCHGKPSSVAWAVTYINPECKTLLLGIPLHPAQLYSALALAIIFIFLACLDWYCKKNGQMLALYLFLAGCERFLIDFFRDDQSYSITPISTLSDHQFLALCIMASGMIMLTVICYAKSQSARVVSQ
jgi:phosphatidylglycerol:prolipoprotein diacylglycerol transferase